MKLNRFLPLLLCMGTFFRLHAQTNPLATALPFSLTAQSSATLPAGVAIHSFSAIPATRTVSPGTGNLTNRGSSPLSNTGGWYHLGTDGIGILTSGANPAGAVVVAINTSGQSGITVSWKCKTIYNQASRDNSIALQYRVGTSGSFINVGTASVYSSTGNANGHSSAAFTETLPAGAENQAVVQVRWIYWESVSTSGSRDKVAVDDISITGSASGSCSAPSGLAASAVTTTSANVSWSTVPGASSYEYAVTASPASPSSGSSTTAVSASAGTLTPGTLYYLHVRSDCSGSFSSWASTSFVTASTEPGEEGQVKVMSYNLLNYPGSTGATREPSFRTVIQDVDPDVLVVQELSQVAGAATFLNNVMNYSSTTYSLGTVIDGPDSDRGIYYKTALFSFISNTPIATALRDINEFKLKHLATGDTLTFFAVHLKAGTTTSDENARTAEADLLRGVTNAMSAGKNFMVCGDFNIYGSSEDAYTHLTQAGSNPDGNFNDLLSLSGSWNNASYAIHHTQSPRTTSFGGGATGGMDDRFDMILFSDALVQPGGFDVIGSTYKAYGNDGMHYNAAINTPPYTMYSSTIASALHDASDHLPVVVSLSYGSSSLALQPLNVADEAAKASSAKLLPEDVLTIYPNPAHNEVYIRMKEAVTQPVALELFNLAGKRIGFYQLTGNPNETLRLPALNPGLYFLRAGEISGTYKLIIE